MLSFFKSNNPGVVVFYLVYLVAFRICFFVAGIQTDFAFNYHEPLSRVLWNSFQHISSPLVLLLIMGGTLQFLQALIVNRLVNENKMTARKTYVPGVMFIVLSSFVPEALIFSPALLALAFLMLATAAVFRLSRKEKAYGDVYDVGFLSSIAVLVYFPSVIFILFAYIGMGTLRPFRPREWGAAFLGFVTPFFAAFVVFYLSGSVPENFLPQHFLSNVHFTSADWYRTAALLFCSLAALALLPVALHSSLIQVRKLTTLLTLLFALLIPAFFLQQEINLSYLALVSFPISVVTSMLVVQFKRPWVPEVIHLILILLALAGQYLPYFHIL